MSGLVARLAALVDAGQLTPADVLQYANYPDRLLSAQERSELGALVADMTRIVPQGRTDGAEYVKQSLNNAEYEAQFAAGLVRKGSLGFASESDMDQNWEGAYFSMYHPAELNPQLRLFANQLNSKVSLVRPTTQRNQSVPMFLTPGIERDPMGARVNMQLNQISSQQASLSQALAQKRLELSRLTKLSNRDPQTITALQSAIKQLEAQIAALDISRRQVYGTSHSYQDNSGALEAPPLQDDILGLNPGSAAPAAPAAAAADVTPENIRPEDRFQDFLDLHGRDVKALPEGPYQGGNADRTSMRSAAIVAGLLFGGSAVSAGASGTGNTTGPTNSGVRNDVPVPDNGEGGQGNGYDFGEVPRPVVNEDAVYDFPRLRGEIVSNVYGALRGTQQAIASVASIAPPAWRDALEAIVSGTPGQPVTASGTNLGGPYQLEPWQTSTDMRGLPTLEDLNQFRSTFDTRDGIRGHGTEHQLPGQSTPLAITQPGTRRVSYAYEQHDPRALEDAAGAMNMLNGPPEVAAVAGAPDVYDHMFRDMPGRMNVPRISLGDAKASAPADSKVPGKLGKLQKEINEDPKAVVDNFKARDKEGRKGLAGAVLQLWRAAAIVGSSLTTMAQDPLMGKYLSAGGMDIQKYLPSQGYGRGKHKRKRSVGRGRGRGRGSVKRHRH